MSLLADFSVRVGLGIAVALLIVPWRTIPPAFFRTQALVLLGLCVLGAVEIFRSDASAGSRVLIVAAGVFAYAASVCWGAGFHRLGGLWLALLAVILAVLLVRTGWGPARAEAAWLGVGSKLASAVLLGVVLTAMLLGHHYLTAPAMSTVPLVRLIVMGAVALGVRAALAGFALWAWKSAPATASSVSVPEVFLVMRWGFGVLAPAVGLFLAWRTGLIRSTQSATGILYATLTLLLLGELSSVVLERTSGVSL